MLVQSQANIFLADQRPCEETDWFRRYTCFHLQDITLAAGRQLPVSGLIIPLAGAVTIDGELIEPGGSKFSQHGVVAQELANFLCVEADAELRLFNGRGEATIHSNGPLFVYAIAGAFEVANRLLHERDGLVLWDGGEIEMEALSNNAIILVSASTKYTP